MIYVGIFKRHLLMDFFSYVLDWEKLRQKMLNFRLNKSKQQWQTILMDLLIMMKPMKYHKQANQMVSQQITQQVKYQVDKSVAHMCQFMPVVSKIFY